tara:strand:+ start:358 stop:672 length:315 start_codon:yes stop_codon:yes gene_type:complete
MKETKKWIFHRLTAIVLTPLFFWFYFSLIVLSTQNYQEAIYFFENRTFSFLTIALFFIGFFHSKISLSEIFEDYIHDKKKKNIANILTSILSIIIFVIIIILLI